MPSLQLNLLGSFSAFLDGQTLVNPGIKSQALLIYLAVERDLLHRRENLFTLLWPGMPEKSARHNLNQAVYALRQVILDLKDNQEASVPLILGDRHTIQINPAANVEVDIYQMDDLLESTQTHVHLDLAGCATCFEALQGALTLYQGNFLSDFYLEDSSEFEAWAEAVRETYHRKVIEVLATLTDIAIQRRDYEQTITYIDRQLVLDDLNERAYRQKIHVLSMTGRRVEAMRQYWTFEQTLADELGVEPSEETKNLYQNIQASTPVRAELQPESNLPVQTTPFIGRESELAEIQAKLKEESCRLLTLLGPGGSGKTRLAIEAARRRSEDYKHGAFFVNLAPLQLAEEIPLATAKALRFSFYAEGTPEEQLLDYLRNKKMLLILDNFEHILDGVAFVNQIMLAAPYIKILATSRTSLTVTGEHIYLVRGMAYPETTDLQGTAANQYSAIRLFESAAKRKRDAFGLTDENNPGVIQVCALVDGMPLGIVLAASWVNFLTPAEIAEEIAQDLAFLETELKNLPRRQRSLQSVFNHSWRLLSEHEQAILCALSVFRGGFTREAALKVAGTSLKDLMGLIDKSMLHRVADSRFEIHELLRQFAAEKLSLDPDFENQIRDNHSDFFCQALADWDRDLDGPRQGAIQQEMAIENYNIHSAWTWAVNMPKLANLLGAFDGLCRFYWGQNRRVAGEKICRSILERLDTLHSELSPLENGLTSRIDIQKLRVRALSWVGVYNWILGNLETAGEFGDQGLALLEKDFLSGQDLRFEKAICLHSLSRTKRFESRVEARKLAKESLSLFKSIHKNWWVGITLRVLADISSSRVESIKYLEECLAIARERGDLMSIAGALFDLSYKVAWQWQFDKAGQMISEAIAIYRDRNCSIIYVYIY